MFSSPSSLFFAFQRGWISKALMCRPLVLLGEISLSTYMLHWLAVRFIVSREAEPVPHRQPGANALFKNLSATCSELSLIAHHRLRDSLAFGVTRGSTTHARCRAGDVIRRRRALRHIATACRPSESEGHAVAALAPNASAPFPRTGRTIAGSISDRHFQLMPAASRSVLAFARVNASA